MIDLKQNYPGVTMRSDRNGEPIYRYRTKGRKRVETKLPGKPGDAAFDAAYRKLTLGQPIKAAVTTLPNRTHERSFWAAAKRLETTMEWIDHSEGTQELNTIYIERFLEMRVDPERELTWRDVPVDCLDADRLRAIIEALFKTRRTAAKHMLVAIKKLLWVAIEIEKWIKPQDDPSLSLKIRMPKSTKNPAWPLPVREKYEARHPIGSVARTTYALGFFLGNRRSDIAALDWSHLVVEEIELFDGSLELVEAFDFRQMKNRNRNGGAEMFLPVVDKLAEALAPLRPASNQPTGPVLKSSRGTGYAADSLTGRMADWCAEAGIEPGYTLHGLRRTYGTYLAECNVQARAIMDAMGHSSMAVTDIYVRDANKKRMAVDVARTVNEREAKRDAMKRRNGLRVIR